MNLSFYFGFSVYMNNVYDDHNDASYICGTPLDVATNIIAANVP